MSTAKTVQGLIGAAALMVSFASCNSVVVPTATRTVSGTITAMGANRSSITVSGQRLTLSSAALSTASDRAQGQQSSRVRVNGSDANEHALSVGQKVEVTATNKDEATEINVRLELKGAVEKIDVTAKTIVVAGKTVTVTSTTRFDVGGDGDDDQPTSSHTLSDIKVGDFVEVTGSTDATGNVTATKIEVKSGPELGEDGEEHDTEFKGAVTNLSATSFTLGANTVNCAAPCTLPTGLKNGDLVEVKGSFDATTKILTATKVRLEETEGHEAEFKGAISNLSATSFTLAGNTVNCAAPCSLPTGLKNGDFVEVEGSLDAATKILTASKVRLEDQNEHEGGNEGGGTGGGGNGGGEDHGGHH